MSNIAVEGEEDSSEAEDISMTTTSTAYSLIETSHPVFRPVKKLWNSNVDSHREVGVVMGVALYTYEGSFLYWSSPFELIFFFLYRFVLFWQLLLRYDMHQFNNPLHAY